MKRRQMLQGLGFGAGAALFAPLFRATASEAACCRVVIVVEGNGIYGRSFLAPSARSAIEAAGADTIGDALWFHRAYQHADVLEVESPDLAEGLCLNPLAGAEGETSLSERAAVVFGLSSTVAGGGHTSYNGALSCARGSATTPAAPTIDTVLGRLLGGSLPFDVLRLGITGDSGRRLMYQTCAFDAGRPAPVITDPTAAFNNLFGSVATGAGAQAFTRRDELLDFARDDVNQALTTFSGSSFERQKLERYLESIEQLTTRQGRLLDSREQLLAVKPDDPESNPLFEAGDPMRWLQAQFDMATAALLGQLTRVVVIASGTGGAFSIEYPSIISGIGRHDLHHSIGNAEFSAAVAEATRQHVGMIAKMARSLDATPEIDGSGTMLDNTVIVYMSDNGEQHHSKAEEWPMLLVGGSGLGFRTDGRTIAYPKHGEANNRQVSNLFNTLGHAAGDPDMNDFGLEGAGRIAEGPLSELLSA